MLRYFYLLCLLIYINLSFCYEYSSDKDSNSRSSMRRLKSEGRNQRDNSQHRKFRKRHDYDIYDKDPVAEIDVASFINSAQDESIGENDPYNIQYNKRRYEKDYNNYGSLTNEILNTNEDYLDMDEDNLQEKSQYMNINGFSENKIINDKFVHEMDKELHDNLHDNVNSQRNKHDKEKKSALKNIKLPFFSHNKSAIAKTKGNKKRKLYNFHIARKDYKGNNEKLSKQDNSRDNPNVYNHDKINKRSYVERLCPACKKYFIVNQGLKSQSKRNNILNNVNDKRNDINSGIKRNLNEYNVDPITITSNEDDILENFWSDKRKKREDDDRNIERQKELEYLEKRVESVTVTKPFANKVTL